MAKAEAEGQLVNIPALGSFCDGGTEEKSPIVLMVWRPLNEERFPWQIREAASKKGNVRVPRKGGVFTLPIRVKSFPRKSSKR